MPLWWFYFDLTRLAQAQAYAALESALCLALAPKPDGNPWTSMGEVLGTALSRGLFDGLPRLEHDTSLSLTYRLKHLFQTIQAFRAHLANETSQPQQISAPLNALRDCANVIDHLFQPA